MEIWYVDINCPLLGTTNILCLQSIICANRPQSSIGNDEKDGCWTSLLALFSANEIEKINKFIFFIDKKRAFLSICMQHALIRNFLQHNYSNYGMTITNSTTLIDNIVIY